ncbi:hypothetical protein EDC44_11079 [Cricetibacter osteomyelitidis]|uniref:Transmembrane protein n=1 Tax=Cricetibacter osteomyelitidis TaxID=1521931 RepID=A0A4R2TDM6_9PAST|nr:hypothetical protein [Cricetibacter osteomyelitidis]TCP95248.1 hypothetical protein EDC44_11079 [Cricetibacter osteomyelitidis]
MNNKALLGCSIRQCNEDEIEIRQSFIDGYLRGFIRAVLVGLLIMEVYIIETKERSRYPFEYVISSIEDNFNWTFRADKFIQPMYEDTIKFYSNQNMIDKYKLSGYDETYDEYKNEYIRKFHKYDFLYFYGTMFILAIIVLLIAFPRARGIRVNRKKRIIYWQTTSPKPHIAYVPEKGDPLSGLLYNQFGLYAFGGGVHFSLQILFKDYNNPKKAPSYAFFGVYPTPNKTHNADILNAIRAYLTEDNPEFLQYIGKSYRTFTAPPLIAFCNALSFAIPFNRKKAEEGITQAFNDWQQPNAPKRAWFKAMQKDQEAINKEYRDEDGLENEVKWEVQKE